MNDFSDGAKHDLSVEKYTDVLFGLNISDGNHAYYNQSKCINAFEKFLVLTEGLKTSGWGLGQYAKRKKVIDLLKGEEGVYVIKLLLCSKCVHSKEDTYSGAMCDLCMGSRQYVLYDTNKGISVLRVFDSSTVRCDCEEIKSRLVFYYDCNYSSDLKRDIRTSADFDDFMEFMLLDYRDKAGKKVYLSDKDMESLKSILLRDYKE